MGVMSQHNAQSLGEGGGWILVAVAPSTQPPWWCPCCTGFACFSEFSRFSARGLPIVSG